jgi:hypothetical protein
MLPFLFDYKLGKCGRNDEIGSLVIVVSPLVSLEQVQKLRTCGVPCAILAVATGRGSYGSDCCERERLARRRTWPVAATESYTALLKLS